MPIVPPQPVIKSIQDEQALIAWAGTFPAGTTFNIYWGAGDIDLPPITPLINIFETDIKSQQSSIRSGVSGIPEHTNIYVSITSVDNAGNESAQSTLLFLSLDNSAQSMRVVGTGIDDSNTYKYLKTDEHGRLITATEFPREISIGDGVHSDPFGRLRVSESEEAFSNSFVLSNRALFWDNQTVGAGSVTRNVTQGLMDLSVSTASGDLAILQTKEYFSYRAGRGQITYLTSIFEPGKTNLRQRAGRFDSNNGYFFQLNGTTLSVVRRTSVSGSPVDISIDQEDWNLDTMDGRGPSREVLDFSNIQQLVIDFSWLGAGRVRVGAFINGIKIYFHEFIHSNIINVPHTRNPNLPIRYEIQNIGPTQSSSTMKAICQSIQSEGDTRIRGLTRSASNGITGRSYVANFPAISIRLRTGFERATIEKITASLAIDSSTTTYVRLVLNGTLTGASWTAVSPNAVSEFDVSATSITGGEILESDHLTSGGRISKTTAFILNNLKLASNIAGTRDTLSLVADKIAGPGNALIFGTLTYNEVY